MYVLPPVPPAPRPLLRRPSTWLALSAAAVAAALLVAVISGAATTEPNGAVRSPGGASPTPPSVLAVATRGPAATPRPSPSAPPATSMDLQRRYVLNNGLIVEQNSKALWTMVRQPPPGRTGPLEFIVRGCPDYCKGATVAAVTAATFDVGFQIGWNPCPGIHARIECVIYAAQGGRGAPIYEPVGSLAELVALTLDRHDGRIVGERQVEGISWTIIESAYGLVGLAVDGDRFVVVVANRGSLEQPELESRLHGFADAIRFVDPSVTWHGVELRTPDGWQIVSATDETVTLGRLAPTSGRASSIRIRAVRPGETVWVTSYPAHAGFEPFTVVPGKGFYASGATFREFREAVEGGLAASAGKGAKVDVDGRPAWTWHVADSSPFGPAFDVVIVRADGVHLLITAQATVTSSDALGDFLANMTFVAADS